jgi:hypothetical protein
MNRADLLAYLTAVKRQVTVGQSLIDAQRRIIASLTTFGSDVTAAEKILAELDRTQDLRLN